MRDGMREKGEERGNANESPWKKTENILSLHGKSMGAGVSGGCGPRAYGCKITKVFGIGKRKAEIFFEAIRKTFFITKKITSFFRTFFFWKTFCVIKKYKVQIISALKK